jgi:hypothetical protein
LGSLILVWLLTRPDGQATARDLNKTLRPLLDLRWSDAEQGRAVDEELSSLERAGRLARRKKSSLALTEPGRREGLAALGLDALPPKYDWRAAKKGLFDRALGLPPAKSGAKKKRAASRKEQICMAILRHRHDLPLNDGESLIKAGDALVGRQLGLGPGERLTLSAVRRAVLNRLLGSTKPLESDKALEQLAARAVAAPRADADELEKAVLKRWLDGSGDADVRSEAPAPAKPAAANAPLDDTAFSERVLAAARASKTGRFGDRKVFISHVFRSLADEGAVPDDLAAFKDRLIAAHRRGLLSLSRADLVGEMDAKDVDASEARYLSATFHFVRI